MTNPNNAVGTNAAYDGRTSVNAFNDNLTIYSRGILSGWGCSPKSGMTVQIGGNGTDRDAAVAEDNAGNKTSINNISGSPIDVTIPAAPSTNSRIDLIVAYADNPPTGVSTVADNPAACGIIVVSGTAAANPTQPTNATIRSAITTDGATGATAYYVILAKIRVGQGVTTIGSGVITQGDVVTSYATPATGTVGTDSIADGAITSDKIDWTTLSYAKTEWSGTYSISQTEGTIYTLDVSSMPTGAVFMVAACTNGGGSDTATGMFTRLQHGSTYGTYAGSVTSWGKFSTVIACFTKASGVGVVNLRAYKDNTTSVNANAITIMAWRVG